MTKDGITEDFRHVYLTTRFELMKHMRKRRLIIAIFLAVLLPLIFYIVPLVRNTGFSNDSDSFFSDNLSFVYLLIIICGAFFAGDTVSSEFDKKTSLISFPLPQRRSSFFIGKYFAAFIATALMVLIFYIITMVEGLFIYGANGFHSSYPTSFVVAILFTLSVISFTFFFTCILKSSMTSTLLSFFILFMVFAISDVVLMAVKIDPWFLLTYNDSLITSVFSSVPITYVASKSTRGSNFSLTLYQPSFITGIEVMAAYAIILFALAIIIGTRREVQ